MQYRRAFSPGGCYFFTLVTKNRRNLFVNHVMIDVLRDAFRMVKLKRPFEIDAIVVLPDHIHCVWTLPKGDADFATRWRLIKTWVTKHCNADMRQTSDPEGGIWQHRYWEHLLRDATDYQYHVDYIHYNAVKHGLVSSPMDWPYSSFRRYVKAGLLPEDWGAEEVVFGNGIGHE